MKNLLRNPGVQTFLSWLLWLHLIITLKSRRWTHDNLACVEPILQDGKPAVALFWHGSIPLCLGLAPVWWRRDKVRCMVSPSADGEFIAQALSRAGFPAIRTSSAKKGDTNKARQAVAAIREAINWVNGGGVLIVTPDGPRGPAEVIAPGSLQIARKTGAPIYLMGLAVSPAIVLDTWDKVTFAWPFGRGATAWDGPYYVPADAGEAEIAALIEDLSAKLTATTRRAEALVRRR
ncbi:MULTISPECIES: lysophospholipid acyltransferase family protein [unclassified Phenylobacterium]|uniref:lysophospholipid acyltransferase family protein n=1 Tax=unclassified Phenylobacterium TaxID=2640670 RepID=UPI0022B2D08F|nr:lysophospholipid acyltransferase family protein [Phenylobacterium sp. NIBR 498073]MBS0488758.1 lysophospholipid acyltransferase family protein [Pseudomonadota bacterium]WGU41035.1 lysophospholipid acyltransferase family protein [Phenylobacterium sp. NIBR 498073]